MIKQLLTGIALCGLAAGQANGATSSIQKDTDNTIPGVCACSIIADGQGADWTGIVLSVKLTSGSVYNGAPDANIPQAAFWAVPGFEKLEWDTWVGVPFDGTNGTAGGAGDIPGAGPFSMSGQSISVTGFNTTTTDTGLVRVANISLTDDAAGTFEMILSFAGGILKHSSGVIEPGWGICLPEPGTLALLGVGVVGLCRRPQFKA